MKKFNFIAGFILLAVLLVSCGKPSKLTFMVGGAPNEIQYWEEIIKDFETNKGIKIEMIRQAVDTDNRRQSLITALRGKQADPDVMLLDIAWIGQFASSGWLEPLSGYNLNVNDYFQSIIKLADTYKGQLIGLPLYVDGGMLYYRTDLLEKYGYKTVPATWKEFAEAAVKVQAGERKNNSNFYGYVWQGAQYEGLICSALEVMVSFGGGIFNEKGESIVASEANVKALEFMTSLIADLKVSPPNTFTTMKEEEVRQFFQDGNALFERNWPYAWALHQDVSNSRVAGKTAISVLPAAPGGKSASTLGGWHVAVSRYSDQKTNAVEFLKYITSYDVQKKLFLKLGWNPGRPDVYADEDVNQAAPHLKELQKVFQNAVPRPTVPYYNSVSIILQKYINSVLSGKMKADEALKTADGEIIKVIREYEASQN